MQNTPKLNLPYPEPSDPPDGASQIKALAEAIESTRPLAGVAQRTTDATGNWILPLVSPTGQPPIAVLLQATTGVNAAIINVYSPGVSASQIHAVVYKADGTRWANIAATVHYVALYA